MTRRPFNTSVFVGAILAVWTVGLLSFCQALDGWRPGVTGVAARWTTGDSGEPIPYRVDTVLLPTGISTSQALHAISNAFRAWSDVTCLQFRFEQLESFGMSAGSMAVSDGRIRIQMHDGYGYLVGGEIGRGGSRFLYNTNFFPAGGLGGRVNTNEYDPNVSGYVVMQHTNAYIQNTQTLAEALCHEIGHALGLAHSSETYPEPNATLREAMMYYLLHMDGRGATLNNWDAQTAQVGYPTNNTPPYGFNRVIHALCAIPPLTPTTYVNQVAINAYDLQNDSVSTVLAASTNSNGTFHFTNGILSFSPIGLFDTDYTIDPNSGGYWAVAYLRASDGVHLSAPIGVRVVSLLRDANRNHLPDTWSTSYGLSNANAWADADGDGFSNIGEWSSGTHPTNALAPASQLAISSFTNGVLSWTAKPYELYQVTSTTNLSTPFSAAQNPSLPTSSNATATVSTTDPTRFFRLEKVP